jgi:1,4-dihydroxy-2-naphthoyl-CoA hydrolase
MPTHVTLEELNQLGKNTIGALLDIRFTVVEDGFLEATMPVDHRTHQPYGYLHGGASVVLAETLGSVGSHLSIDHTKFAALGLEVNANHIRPVRSGLVTGKATLLQKGCNIHVWEIKIYDERKKLVCVSRLTVAIVAKQLSDLTP